MLVSHRRKGAKAPGVQRVKSQKLKYCNYLSLFRTVRLLTHVAWIYFFKTCFFVSTNLYVFQMPVFPTFLNTRDSHSGCTGCALIKLIVT